MGLFNRHLYAESIEVKQLKSREKEAKCFQGRQEEMEEVKSGTEIGIMSTWRKSAEKHVGIGQAECKQ